MFNNSLQEFLKLENPEEYNFEKESFQDKSDCKTFFEKASFERYLIYASLKNDCKNSCYENGKKFAIDNSKGHYNILDDCDGSSCSTNANLIRDIYSQLWGWKKNDKDAFGRLNTDLFDCSFGGETMNSVQTSLNAFIDSSDSRNKDSFDIVKNNNKVSLNLCLELFTNENTKGDFSELLSKSKNLNNYIDVYHTLGNFTLIPAYMNAWRGTNNNIKDYWDKTLLYLKNKGWNPFKRPKSINIDFIKFINYFYLWGYLDKTGTVKSISPRSDNDPVNTLEKFWESTHSLIIERGKFMIYMLHLAEKLNKDKFLKLRREVFEEQDELYTNYDTVKSKIKSLC